MALDETPSNASLLVLLFLAASCLASAFPAIGAEDCTDSSTTRETRLAIFEGYVTLRGDFVLLATGKNEMNYYVHDFTGLSFRNQRLAANLSFGILGTNSLEEFEPISMDGLNQSGLEALRKYSSGSLGTAEVVVVHDGHEFIRISARPGKALELMERVMGTYEAFSFSVKMR